MKLLTLLQLQAANRKRVLEVMQQLVNCHICSFRGAPVAV